LKLMGAGAAAAMRGLASGAAHAAEAPHTAMVPSSGEALPVIGLGTWQTFDVGATAAERAPLADVLAEFVRLGGRIVDSSPMYGRSESVLGELAAKAGVRETLFVATKVWTTGRDAGIRQMEQSIAKLRGPVDLMQVHNLIDAATHLATLADWKKSRRIRYLGVTHYTAGAHDDVARAIERWSPDFIQINYSVGEREAERRLLPLAHERGVAVLANRPFAGGDLLRRLRAQPLPAWATEIGASSWAQLLLKFVVSHPAITCAIPATSRVTHLRDNLGAAFGPMPDAALRARIASAAV
jgi:diketogulonate reductase-like aldo/keto reductase